VFIAILGWDRVVVTQLFKVAAVTGAASVGSKDAVKGEVLQGHGLR